MNLPQLIGLKAISSHSYEVFFKTKLLGTATKDIDGYYYFWPQGDDPWSRYDLQLLVDTLNFLNEPFDIKLKAAFESDY
jgi:hypothetical protein